MRLRIALLSCSMLGLFPLAAEEKDAPALELNGENYASWRDHVLPESSELAWEKIPWLTTFKDGIAAANAAEKPLLFWTMNGHPLGCTGAKLTATLLHEMKRRGARYGVVSMCIGGGMGAAAVFERS